MVIQRWQSVYLLLAVFSILLVCLRPFAIIELDNVRVTELVAFDYPVFLVINILTGLLLLLDIFLYKNLKLQKMVASVCLLLIVASAITVAILLYNLDSLLNIAWSGAPVGLICALICTAMARYRMTHDENILKSYDRIR